ncbi:protein CHUP1, chloroplastic [Canna indica]|uniref:Protein CHUP1, chloroplastic n=1 Tax=Canna indica TaxID=4628 RepID=A0AAQ3K1J5_9LILI|nr:protein CHUP1, chloroplastic [Canna indica]
MERRNNRGEEIKGLLLKLAIPLSLPLSALIFSIFTRNSRAKGSRTPTSFSSQAESLMDSSESISSTSLLEFEAMDSSECHIYQEEEEDEKSEAMDSFGTLELLRKKKDLSPSVSLYEFEEEEEEMVNSSKIMRAQCSENPSDIFITNFQDGNTLEQEIEGLKSRLSELENGATEIESQIREYCDAKEQESLYQKLQIMCLGFKLECLEAQNQRLEDAIANQGGAFKKLRVELKTLQRKVKKLSRVDRLHLLQARQQALLLNSREDELLRINEELNEVKDLAAEMMEEKKALDKKFDSLAATVHSASKRKEEMIDDHNTRLLSNRELLDQLELFRYQWYHEMEELIYIGWVGASLRHELLINQEQLDEEEEEEEEDAKPGHEIGNEVIMEVPANEEVKSCRVEFHTNGSECPSSLVAEPGGDREDKEEDCLGVALVRTKNSRPKKTRLLHKLKGWAKAKGRGNEQLQGGRERWCG